MKKREVFACRNFLKEGGYGGRLYLRDIFLSELEKQKGVFGYGGFRPKRRKSEGECSWKNVDKKIN